MTAAVIPERFTALPVQERLFDTMRDGAYRIIGFGGGIRGTKTWGTLAAFITLCRLFPRSRWAVVRKDLPTLRRNTIPSFNKLRPLFGDFIGPVNQSDWTATCTNGSQLVFFPESLDTDPDLSRWKGLEVNGFDLEEADELAERSYYKAIERAGAWIVPDGAQPPPYVVCTFNPCAGWPKRVFYEPWKHGTIQAPYAFIPATAADNPYISEAQREAWRSLPEQEYRRFVEGDWDVLAGRYYDGLNAGVHLRPRDELLPKEIPAWWETWMSYDWGYAHWATMGLWVRTPDGLIVRVDGYRMRRAQDHEQCDAMVRLAKDHGLERALTEVYAGHDCWEQRTARGATGIATADVMAERGVFLRRAATDKVSGGRAVRRALHVTDGVPGMVMVETPMNRLAYDQLAEILPDPKDVNKPLKVDADSEGRGGDDFADEVRYGLSIKFGTSEPPRSPLIDAPWEHDKDTATFRPGWDDPEYTDTSSPLPAGF